MRLTKLEISGFKSFAKSTVLEFPSKITAIVGPNGSGKSNVVEAVRWVLGEQSIKSLRGKRGEDLIYNGSPKTPRMGKASVELFFDNKDHRIPIDFDEVVISRKIFRDGLNEYYINNSQTRLKDVVEMMARIGLGHTQHNIISQGEVDRMLLSSSRDRREMLEEALGLRVYHLKKNEAERKLLSTEENIKQVESLIREIAPHLKFLRTQAEKAEKREVVENELKSLQKIYFTLESESILKEKSKLSEEKAPFEEAAARLEKEISAIVKKISDEEESIIKRKSFSIEEKSLTGLETKRREIERELGRLEGRLEMEKQREKMPKVRLIDALYIQKRIEEFIQDISALLEEGDRLETFRQELSLLKEDLERLKEDVSRGRIEEKPGEVDESLFAEIKKTISDTEARLQSISGQIEEKNKNLEKEQESWRISQTKIREEERALREKEEEKRDLVLRLQRFDFENERIDLRETELARGLKEAGFEENSFKAETLDGYEGHVPEEVKKKIERLRARLEEIGGIDQMVVKEFKETEARHEFLSREIEDLKNASLSLDGLIKELEDHIENDFKAGFSKIKEEFNNYFRVIFGGGSAKLQITSLRQNFDDQIDAQEITEGNLSSKIEPEAKEEGIEIDVDLPKKRIKGLAMLSGGEKALTSIALLFAITAVNPPPFLVLDETDAALDEANSRKYATILKELAKRTQLILVTHNRETMASAGILYGVTMGDDGISKLLSLKLEEAEIYTSR